MVDDNIFREVDEELRRERLNKYWDKYGSWVIGAAVGFVLIVAGSLQWQNWQTSKRQAAGDQFIEALKLVAQGKDQQAAEKLKTLSESGPQGYEVLSKLHLASVKAANGETGEAEIMYKKIAIDPSADKILSDYAKLNLAMLRLDGATYDETDKALSGFTKKGAMWRPTALELVALAALKEDKLDIAKNRFTDILVDGASPNALKRRAQIMLDVIASRAVNQPNGESSKADTNKVDG